MQGIKSSQAKNSFLLHEHKNYFKKSGKSMLPYSKRGAKCVLLSFQSHCMKLFAEQNTGLLKVQFCRKEYGFRDEFIACTL